MREYCYYVYMLASHRNGTLYVGVTNDIVARLGTPKRARFTKKYGAHILVWYETHADIGAAILREKQLKGRNRAWKIRLIEQSNSGWNNLYDRLCGDATLPDNLPARP